MDRSGAEVPTFVAKMSAKRPFLGTSTGVVARANLFAEERNPSIVDGIFGDDVQDAGILLRGAPERGKARGHVVEHVLYLSARIYKP